MEWPPSPRRTGNSLCEQREFFTGRCVFGRLGVGSRRHAGQSIRVRFMPDRLAWWPRNAIREILSKAKGRDALGGARVEDVDHRNFERDEFRTCLWQQVKKLEGTPRVLRARIRCRHLDRGI